MRRANQVAQEEQSSCAGEEPSVDDSLYAAADGTGNQWRVESHQDKHMYRESVFGAARVVSSIAVSPSLLLVLFIFVRLLSWLVFMSLKIGFHIRSFKSPGRSDFVCR